MKEQTLRIIDASLNRVGEGLRLLEDVARLLLDDTSLTQQLKTMRHELIVSDNSFQQQLLDSRNSEGDVGVDLEVPGEGKERELSSVVVANARRIQEALRTLEELAKVPEISSRLDSEKFKQARFSLYAIERELMSRLLREEKRKNISGLYVIISKQVIEKGDYRDVATQTIRGGATAIELHGEFQTKESLIPVARQLRALCAEHKVLFIIGSYLDLALASDADGLLLKEGDLPIQTARKLLPLGKILGCSVTAVEQAKGAQAEGADYIIAGPVYPNFAGENVVGLENLKKIKQAVSLPLVAFGGITKDNASEVIAAGADSVAVIGSVSKTESAEEASQQIVQAFKCGVEWINQ